MNIDPKIEQNLITLAERRNTSVNALLGKFTAEQMRYDDERAEDMRRLENARTSGGIPHEEMKKHFDILRAKARARL